MKLEKNEYTTATFLELLTKDYKEKINGSPFTSNDVAQYLLRGYTPHRYGNLKITAKDQDGIRIITVTPKETIKANSKK